MQVFVPEICTIYNLLYYTSIHLRETIKQFYKNSQKPAIYINLSDRCIQALTSSHKAKYFSCSDKGTRCSWPTANKY